MTAAEQSELSAWYAQEDVQESALLTANAAYNTEVVKTLREQVNTSLTELHAVTEHIQTLIQENQTIHSEIQTLYQRLTQMQTASAA